MSEENATWLPNLVGGVSIWKLAVDLNEPKFFDGRLLVPETEGSESLPVTVRWDLTGLVPLADAQEKHQAETQAAIADFRACLERVAKVFSTPNSGFDKYKEAFTVPSIEADGGANYFYSPEKKKLYVINWGASPRAMGGKAEYVFGYEDWGRAFKDKDAGSSAAAIAAAAVAGAAAGAGGAAVAASQPKAEDDKKKKDEQKKDDKKRPWWMWPLFALIAIALVLLALLLLRNCDEQKNLAGQDAAADALADANANANADAAADAGADVGADASADAMAEAGADAGADAAGDAGADAAADAGGDGGKDGGKDGGSASNDDGDGDDDDGDGSSGGGGGGAGSGKVTVTIGPAGTGTGGAKTGPHRRHYQKEATQWRIVSGNDRVSRTEQRGHRFDVWLGPGRTFEGVRVEWHDGAGKWHAH